MQLQENVAMRHRHVVAISCLERCWQNTPAQICTFAGSLHWRVFCSALQQLDSQMHKMMLEKHRRTVQMKEDQAALEKIDDIIRTHVQPNLVRPIE